MFRMDRIVKNLVEFECQKQIPKCPYLTRLELDTCILGQLEADGKVMRYLARNGKRLPWKATPKMRKEVADYEALLAEDNDNDDDD